MHGSSCCRHQGLPDAAIVSTDGALESADYKWRLEVQAVEAHTGDLGVALHDELAATAGPPPHRDAGGSG